MGVLFAFYFLCLQSLAGIDIGIGSSSFTGGRPVPTLAIGVDAGHWGLLYRGVGVQTSIYAQNAWTLAAYETVYSEKFGNLSSSIGAGAGGSYILRTFRSAPTDDLESTHEYVIGPHLCLKFEFGPVHLGFDTLLGLTRQIVQHLALNFQDMSNVTIGMSF